MIAIQVKRCTVFNEFNREQQSEMFSIHRDKTLHHIDTFYYAVSIEEPDDIIKRQKEDNLPEELNNMISKLREMKAYSRCDQGKLCQLAGLDYNSKAFSIYEFCVSLPECFDIFISSYLPNDATPRIVVQLRSRYIVLEGIKQAIDNSLSYLSDFLEQFKLFPVSVRINRIDYAFHTNLIQSPYKFFCDEKLCQHLKTNLRIYQKIGKIGEKIEVDTFNLGNRKSNNVYFRAYNKCREVIEMNYKAFFIDRWYQNGLISAFDKFVYEVAYELKSYRTGVLVGRLRWYLKYGSDEELLKKCKDLLQKDFINSDNCSAIEKAIQGIIPEPTVIVNVEFQTKRKFYLTCTEWMNDFVPFSEMGPCFEDALKATMGPINEPCVFQGGDPLLSEVYFILDQARAIIEYLTGFGGCVAFVKDRSISKVQFMKRGQPYMNWWKRLRNTPIDYSPSSILPVYRNYDVNASIRKSRRLFAGQVARLAILKNESTEARSFVEDMSDALCVLNDNDLPPIEIHADENGEIFEPDDYSEIRARKSRQLRGIVKKRNITKKE